MNIQDNWEKALRKTEIIRPRVQPLHTFAVTHVPYTFLSESSINSGDTVVRKGEVEVQKPAIVLPWNMPQFEGFDLDLTNSFFLMRGISFPSLKYHNKTVTLEVYEGKLTDAIKHHQGLLAQNEDVHSGLLIGPEDCWQFSVILFACSQTAKSASNDIQQLFDSFHRPGFSSLS